MFHLLCHSQFHFIDMNMNMCCDFHTNEAGSPEDTGSRCSGVTAHSFHHTTPCMTFSSPANADPSSPSPSRQEPFGYLVTA